MAYDNAIPQPTDIPSDSRSQLLANFQAIATLIEQNHVPFNTGVGQDGKHKFLQMPEQSAAPTVAANEGGIYTKESDLTTDTQLYWRRESNGTEIEFTNALEATSGWTRLPSNILLKWGSVAAPGAGSNTLNFPAAGTIPVFSNIFIILLALIDPAATGFIYLTAQAPASFNYEISSALTFNYLAIGN